MTIIITTIDVVLDFLNREENAIVMLVKRNNINRLYMKRALRNGISPMK